MSISDTCGDRQRKEGEVRNLVSKLVFVDLNTEHANYQLRTVAKCGQMTRVIGKNRAEPSALHQ